MVGGTWAGAAPSSLPSDPTSCWLPLDMELLHRQVLTLQTQRVLLGMWVDRDGDTWVSPRRVAPYSRLLLTASQFLHREAAEGFSLAAEPGLPPGHAVFAGTDGGYTSLGGGGE